MMMKREFSLEMLKKNMTKELKNRNETQSQIVGKRVKNDEGRVERMLE